MTRHKIYRNTRSGISLIEVMISVAIISIVASVAVILLKDTYSLNRMISGSLTAQGEGRRAIKMMSAEIRVASPSNLGAYAIAQAATSSITFYSNVDGDSYKEQVRYFLQGTTLKKGVIKPSGTPLAYGAAQEQISEVVHDVSASSTAPIFSYYNEDYDGTTAPLASPVNIAAVRLVKVMIIIDKDPQKSPGPLILTTQISMRNLKDNL
ncbi:prepilin-type N-terminal cleavage/methylation domain-containing protein [Candidatus Kaiserbacteria bacterium]|nr:prepilin-type N-terminal cleavage/methylation domain-containing protein [Candidatus Kaiserbacteria bacterium]